MSNDDGERVDNIIINFLGKMDDKIEKNFAKVNDQLAKGGQRMKGMEKDIESNGKQIESHSKYHNEKKKDEKTTRRQHKIMLWGVILILIKGGYEYVRDLIMSSSPH